MKNKNHIINKIKGKIQAHGKIPITDYGIELISLFIKSSLQETLEDFRLGISSVKGQDARIVFGDFLDLIEGKEPNG